MRAAPPRYLVAYLGAFEPASRAVLRFPPGVTLEDAGLQYVLLPALPPDALGRLSGLGVKVVATGRKAQSEAVRRVGAGSCEAHIDAFAEDYLDVNARLGGERCVTIAEYAMDTRVGRELLDDVLRDRLRDSVGVRVYGDAAFREGGLPGVLHLRAWSIAYHELSRQRRLFVPCRLHGDGCRGYPRDIIGDSSPYWAVYHALDDWHRRDRVAVPRDLLDGLRRRSGLARHRAARDLMRLVLGALPGNVWRGGAWMPKPDAFDAVVAAAAAETCEEFWMLAEALQKCRSAREVVRRARDASWVVSRTLENLRDRW